jgi:hypothetical protein
LSVGFVLALPNMDIAGMILLCPDISNTSLIMGSNSSFFIFLLWIARHLSLIISSASAWMI